MVQQKHRFLVGLAIGGLVTCGLTVAVVHAQTGSPLEGRQLEQILGRAPAVQPGNVLRFAFPRSDLQVTLDGVALKPALALGGWAAFVPMGKQAMLMGDLVLLPKEIPAVMSKLQEGGIRQEALHNHLAGTAPSVLYMHIVGEGDPLLLAKALREGLAASATPLTVPPPPSPGASLDLDTETLDRILGYRGRNNGGVLQYAVQRAETIREGGMAIPPQVMGISLNFQPLGGGRAAATGDIALIASEVNPIIRTLRTGDIAVTALHSHTLDEEPRLFHLHFWTTADATRTARTLRSALDRLNIRKP
jgi:hypothetical protein